MRRLWCGLANLVLVSAWVVATGCGGNFSTSVDRAQGDNDLPEYVQAMFRQPVSAGPRNLDAGDPLGEAPGSDGEPADVGATSTGGRSRQEGDPGGGEGDPTTSSPVDPPPDPYIEGDPTTSSPVDPPPDPYIEGDPTTSSPV
ncbi:MAG: hypothetical protein IT204_09355, partial [Fimbriimonadaceae bacterium]|nr:hypothetical protein [Fimbriimonadaceae bacterium]